MKIHLTIKSDYMPTWKTAEGIRELVQNAKDSQDQYGAPMSVELKGGKLTIKNQSVTLSHEALLLGHSTKEGQDLIGQYGEGLKGGILALVRDGMTVKIKTGQETWIPTLEKGAKFSSKVLTFNITKTPRLTEDVVIEISPIRQDLWDKLKVNFLFLGEKGQHVETDEGDLLLEPRHKGSLFVKGILVEQDDKLEYGYNFCNMRVDRDRRMVSKYDAQYSQRIIWNAALVFRPDLIETFISMVKEEKADLVDLNSYNVGSLPTIVVDTMVTQFQTEHGPEARVVSSSYQADELAALGAKGVILNKQYQNLLHGRLGATPEAIQALRSQVTETFCLLDLTDQERCHLEEGIRLVGPLGQVEPLNLRHIRVVSFRDTDMTGLYIKNSDRSEDIIEIDRKVLNSKIETIKVLVRQICQQLTCGAMDEMERIWSTLYEMKDLASQKLPDHNTLGTYPWCSSLITWTFSSGLSRYS